MSLAILSYSICFHGLLFFPTYLSDCSIPSDIPLLSPNCPFRKSNFYKTAIFCATCVLCACSFEPTLAGCLFCASKCNDQYVTYLSLVVVCVIPTDDPPETKNKGEMNCCFFVLPTVEMERMT